MLIQKVNILCEQVLHITIERLDLITSNIGLFYGEYSKAKRDKSEIKRLNKPQYRKSFGLYMCRTINPPKVELKTIQKRINQYLVCNIPLPSYAYGGVKKRDNILNAKKHKGQKYVFQTDLKDFYPFITSKMVYDMFVRKGFSADVSSKLTKLTTFNGHLPQGAPTSTTIANLVFEPTGLKILQFANERQLRFTTFVDDVTVSSQLSFKESVSAIIKILIDDGYRISHSKTTYKSGINEITGVQNLNNAMTTTEKFNMKYSHKEIFSETTVKGMDNYKSRIKQISSNKK